MHEIGVSQIKTNIKRQSTNQKDDLVLAQRKYLNAKKKCLDKYKEIRGIKLKNCIVKQQEAK